MAKTERIETFGAHLTGLNVNARYTNNTDILAQQQLMIDRYYRVRKRRDLSEMLIQLKESIIITFNSPDDLVQINIASDGNNAYLILLYKKTNKLITASFNSLSPDCTTTTFFRGVNATETSNINWPGAHVFAMSEFCKRSLVSVGKIISAKIISNEINKYNIRKFK